MSTPLNLLSLSYLPSLLVFVTNTICYILSIYLILILSTPTLWYPFFSISIHFYRVLTGPVCFYIFISTYSIYLYSFLYISIHLYLCIPPYPSLSLIPFWSSLLSTLPTFPYLLLPSLPLLSSLLFPPKPSISLYNHVSFRIFVGFSNRKIYIYLNITAVVWKAVEAMLISGASQLDIVELRRWRGI